MSKLYKKGFEAPVLNLKENMCAKYARLSAELMSGSFYIPSNAWDFHKSNNLLLKKINNYELKHNINLLIPKKTIVTFYDPSSKFNKTDREVTHTMLYLGQLQRDLFFAEQRKDKQQIISLSDIATDELIAREIFSV